MTGLIWVIQLVHYPSFRYVDSSGFREFHQHHTKWTGVIVVPVMLGELITSFLLFLSGSWLSANSIGFYVVAALWLVTFFIQVPLHNKLTGGKDKNVINRLVQSNWVRTALWTAKAGINFWVWPG